MNKSVYIKYDNIVLRQLAYDDIEKLRLWRNDSANNRFLSDIGYISSEQQEKWFEKYQKSEDEIIFAIDETNALNNMVGSLSLYNISKKTAEFGHMLIGDDKAHGLGIGKKSIVMLLKYGFEILNLDKVYCYVNMDNLPALNNYIYVGFMLVGEKKSNSLSGGLDYKLEIDIERLKAINKYYSDIILKLF